MSDDGESWKNEPREPRKTFDDQLAELLQKDPFEPFRLTMTSGATYDVTNPLMFAFGPVTFTLYHREGMVWLRKSEIAHVDIPEPAA